MIVRWRFGPKDTIYTRPNEFIFFCPPTKLNPDLFERITSILRMSEKRYP